MFGVVSIECGIVKRSYSDQSVRGYLTEVRLLLSTLIPSTGILNIFFNYCSERVGGTKCAKKNFSSYLDANVRSGRIAGSFRLVVPSQTRSFLIVNLVKL